MAQLISHVSNKKLYKPYPIKSITKNKLSDLILYLIPFVTGQEHFKVLHNWSSQQKPPICSKFFHLCFKTEEMFPATSHKISVPLVFYTKVQINNNFEIHKSSHILLKNSNWLADIQKSLPAISLLSQNNTN